jgi:integrase
MRPCSAPPRRLVAVDREPAGHQRSRLGRRQHQLVLAPPKGGKERDVPLPESVKARLAAHLERFPAREVTLPWREPGGKPVTVTLTLTSPTGLAVNRNSFNRGPWKAALEAAGVPAGRENGCHALRHYHASILLHDGVDIRRCLSTSATATPGSLRGSTRT